MLAELARLRVDQLLVQTASTLLSLGFTRIGGLPDAPELRDPPQARLAIEALVALRPVIEPLLPPASSAELRGALAELQLAYAEAVGAAGGPTAAGPPGGGSPGAGQTAPTGPPPRPAAGGPPPPPRRPEPERPKIWTPRGDV